MSSLQRQFAFAYHRVLKTLKAKSSPEPTHGVMYGCEFKSTADPCRSIHRMHCTSAYLSQLKIYPSSSFDPLISHPSTRNVRVTIADLRLYSTCPSCNQARFCYCTLHDVSGIIERTLCSLTLLFSQPSPQINCPSYTVPVLTSKRWAHCLAVFQCRCVFQVKNANSRLALKQKAKRNEKLQ